MATFTMPGSTVFSTASKTYFAKGQPAGCAPTCSVQPRSVNLKANFRGGALNRLRRSHQATVSQRRCRHVTKAGLGDVGKYLSEAATAVFSPAKDEVPWAGSSFSGKVSHHEGDVPRLRRLYKAVQQTREQLAGCMDPNASNYDPNAVTDSGTCTYLYQDPETGEKTQGNLRDFITSTVGSLFGGKSSNDNEPDWEGTGYAYSGDIVSQRDIDRLLRYESVVKQTLEKAEASQK